MESDVTKLELTVICPYCGQRFASEVQMEPRAWEGFRVGETMLERCAHCRRYSRFAKGDYLFVTD